MPHNFRYLILDFWFSPLTSGSLVSSSAPQHFWFLTIWCRGIGGGIVLIGPVRDFLFGNTRVWTGDLWISSPALYHCAMATSGFHLWQFQVFNSGAEGLVVVLFWLDLWEIFFLATPRFELGTSGSLVLHSTIVPWWLLFFTSDNFRYFILVQRDWWWYCSYWMCERFSFWNHQGLNQRPLHLYSYLNYCATVTSGFHLWQFQVFNSGADGFVVVLFWLDLWEIFFLATPGFELGTSGSLVLHSTTVPRVTSGFHLWQFQVFNSAAESISGGIVLNGTVRGFLFAHTRLWTGDLWISSTALFHCTTATLVFTFDNLKYLSLVH